MADGVKKIILSIMFSSICGQSIAINAPEHLLREATVRAVQLAVRPPMVPAYPEELIADLAFGAVLLMMTIASELFFHSPKVDLSKSPKPFLLKKFFFPSSVQKRIGRVSILALAAQGQN